MKNEWMIFMRASDGIHFLWNGEGCIPVSPDNQDSLRWHHDYGNLPRDEIELLNDTMESRSRIFTITGHGRYMVIAKGHFRDL